MRLFRVVTGTGGLALIGYGLYGMLNDRYIEHPWDVLRWAVGGLLIHDGLWVPVVCLAGATFARSTPVRTGLIVTAAVTAVGLPAVLREGVNHGNPSVLPLPYGRNLLLTLAAIALFTAGWEAQRRGLPRQAMAAVREAGRRQRARSAERRARRAARRR
jgi:hypothetical protein